MNRDNVRVIQRRERLRLLCKTCGELCIVRTLWREQLQRHETVQGLLPCFIDHAHTAPAQAFEDFELREVRSQFLRC